ncbi:MAG: DMT family transporter [Persicimonas sp.]
MTAKRPDEQGPRAAGGEAGRLRRWVPLALIVAVVAISFAAIFFRKAAPTHPLASAAIRLAVAATVLLPFTARGFRRGTFGGRAAVFAAIAGLFYGVHFGAWVWSLELTTVAASVTIVTATPLLLGIVGVVTGRDRPTGRLWISIGLAAVGLLLVGGYDAFAVSQSALLGDGLALLGAAAMAGYLLVARALGEELDILAFAGVATAVGAVSLAVVGLAAGVSLAPASQEALVYLVLAALVPQLIGHNLLTWSLRYATPTAVGIATVGEPVGATILGWLWLGESVAPVVIGGCLVTLSGVVLAVLHTRSRAPAPSTGD